jgi:hypothetical protein
LSSSTRGCKPWRNTLRELSYATSDTALAYTRGLSRARRLREFKALGILRVQTVCFDFGGDIGPSGEALTSALPPSTHRLRLLGPGDLAPGLLGLVGAVESGRFGQLRTVEIDDQGDEGDGRESEARRGLGDVAAAFRSARVSFIVHPLSLQE